MYTVPHSTHSTQCPTLHTRKLFQCSCSSRVYSAPRYFSAAAALECTQCPTLFQCSCELSLMYITLQALKLGVCVESSLQLRAVSDVYHSSAAQAWGVRRPRWRVFRVPISSSVENCARLPNSISLERSQSTDVYSSPFRRWVLLVP